MNPDSYTMSDYLAALKRRRRMFALIAAPIAFIAAALAVVLPDSYRSSARFEINLEGPTPRSVAPLELTRYADQYIARLQDRVITRSTMMELAEDPDSFETDVSRDAGALVGRILDSLSVSVQTQPVLSDRGREVDLISGFVVASKDHDPAFAYRVAVFAADKFAEVDREKRVARASSALAFLTTQIADVEQKIREHEQQIADFKVEHACCLPELMELNMSVIDRTERELEGLQPRLRALDQDRQFLQRQLNEVRSQSGTAGRLAELEQEFVRLVANYGADHPDVARVRREILAITSVEAGANDNARLTELRMRLAEAELKYSDEHPDVIRYKQEISALERELGSSASRSDSGLVDNPRFQQLRSELNAINTELSTLRQREPELRAKIREYEDRLSRTPQIESQYLALNRNLQGARDSFARLQEDLATAEQTEALESTEISARIAEVRSPGLAKSPSGPPRIAIMIVGLFLATTFGIAAMLLAEMTDSTVRGSKDLAQSIEMVPIATIPVVQNAASMAARRRYMVLASGTMFVVVAGMVFILLRTFA